MTAVTTTIMEPQIMAAANEIAELVARFPPEARAAATQGLIGALAENAKRELGGMFDVSHRRWAEVTAAESSGANN